MIFKTQDSAAIFLKVTAALPGSCLDMITGHQGQEQNLLLRHLGHVTLAQTSWVHCFPDPDPHELFQICPPERWSW